MSWYTRDSVGNCWVERQDGKTSVGFCPNQFGKVKCLGLSRGVVDGGALLTLINDTIAEKVLKSSKVKRFGVSGSSQRRELCGRIASALNGAGIAPFGAQPAPVYRR